MTTLRYLKSFLLLLYCISSIAQEGTIQSTSPTRMKWFQINTNHFRVLFPEHFDDQAQRMANTLEHIREPEGKSLEKTPRKITVILHNQSATSNGFVTQAPWRSEWYTMPSQNYNFTGLNDWLTLLASHEYRHMVQFEKSNTGVGKITRLLFGQLAQSGLAFFIVPQWFWEGDAVATETAFTGGGRGRIPHFNLLLRTNLLENRAFSYDKQYLRSYKDNIPNHYVLGYHMVSFLRKKTGNPLIWSAITKRAWNVPFPFAFSHAIKKETGMYVKDLYNEMMLDLKQQWSQQQKKIKHTSFETITRRKSTTYTNYAYPRPLEDGRIVALKSGIGNIATLVTINPDGREHKQFVPGLINQTGMLSVADNKIVWNEYHYDPRWTVRSYFMIKAYDLTTKKINVIGRKSRYATAALSPDGTKIATVETNSNSKTQLAIVGYPSGKEIKRVYNPENRFIITPRWSENGENILFIALAKGQKHIMRYDIESDKTIPLLAVGKENISYPIPAGRHILYNSPISGIDNLYAIDTTTKRQFQITSSTYGAYNPAVSSDGKTIYYNEQTKDGLDIVKIPFDTSAWKPIDEIEKTTQGIYSEMLTEQEGHPELLQHIPSKQYPIKRYHRLQGAFNPHSWGLYTDPSFNTLRMGILSQDILNTTTVDLGYSYNPVNNTGYWYTNLNYKGLYPILNLSMKYANRSTQEAFIQDGTRKTIQFDWNELDLSTGLRIPLITTRSKYISNLSIGNFVGIIKTNNFRNSQDGKGRFIPIDNNQGLLFRSYVDEGALTYNHFNAYASHMLKQSRKDIHSRWGQYLSINLFSTYPGGDYEGSLFSALAIGYFPGLFAHQSFWVYGAYQYRKIEQKINNYLFTNQAPTPRGQRVTTSQNYYSLSANYTLPLLYPDLTLGPVLNIQRIWGTAFVDFAQGLDNRFDVERTYTSIGGELMFDINVLRLLPKISLGVRYAYAVETQGHSAKFILGRIGF